MKIRNPFHFIRPHLFRRHGVLPIAALLLWAPASQAASILIGTVVTAQPETIPEINQLIEDYNTDFGASLPLVVSQLDKLEGEDSADFVGDALELSDFDFYQQDDDGLTELNIFDEMPETFTESTLGAAAGFGLDLPVFAFEQLSGPSFDYYVSKDGPGGWSLWAYMPGLNPVYTDSADGGFTRGVITDNTLAYDPHGQGVSHIGFYSTIPEPGSSVLFGIALVFSLAGRRRPASKQICRG